MVVVNKERLNDYRKLCKEIDFMIERSERLAQKLNGPSGMSISGMPKTHNKNDRISMILSKKVEIDNITSKLRKKEQKERKVIERVFSQLDPKLSFIMNIRYIDGFGWDEINSILFRNKEDFDIEEKTKYMNCLLYTSDAADD